MNIFPVEFVARLQKMYPLDFENILKSFEEERKGSFRLNFLKCSEQKQNEIFEELAKKNITIFPFAEKKGVFFFDRKDEFVLKGTKAFYEGKIYLQSLASMIPVWVLNPQKNEKILDVCAAPGSKTTQIASQTHNEAKIFACEKNQIRYEKLLFNLKTQGATGIEAKKMDALKFLENPNTPKFDKILLDAPCSAEGRFSAQNEKSFGFWSVEKVQKNADLQHQLFSAALKKLKISGEIVYSTCTLSPEENEMVVQKILDENPDIVLEEISLFDHSFCVAGMQKWEEKIFSNQMTKTLRILPSAFSEGFFVAKLRKIRRQD